MNPHPPPPSRVYYIDDSGTPGDGMVFYSAIGVPCDQTAAIEGNWREHRRSWEVEHGVPADYELHANKLIPGRGRPGGRNLPRIERWLLAQAALDVIGAASALDVITVYAHEPGAWREARERAFGGALRAIDRRLARSGEYGHVVVDGDGTDAFYAATWQSLSPPRLPIPLTQESSASSDWLQMADLVAYTAFQAVARRPARQHMWGWYTRYLPKAGEPVRL
ncbi:MULTISPECIES: DUF3800 domain-containing protein [unclassified Streptomyces]|uniref:DUF3800 domain-containing protein n=1 Tax=unclassified Streptomyces TaxID=2593676 RepID=UPI0022B64522|nr:MULTISPECIES: DUF3800 domain-containing protein [unclassified Streptomyces]MCZ7414871.1 DUF3800 domain-containing protein [Streptomyces sp. WMMC897]MCZ7431814.1 DUF3800 domain-containing protein [Streptomyces sp. WMMC1477]